jgi:hypothetical protein
MTNAKIKKADDSTSMVRSLLILFLAIVLQASYTGNISSHLTILISVALIIVFIANAILPSQNRKVERTVD